MASKRPEVGLQAGALEMKKARPANRTGFLVDRAFLRVYGGGLPVIQV